MMDLAVSTPIQRREYMPKGMRGRNLDDDVQKQALAKDGVIRVYLYVYGIREKMDGRIVVQGKEDNEIEVNGMNRYNWYLCRE